VLAVVAVVDMQVAVDVVEHINARYLSYTFLFTFYNAIKSESEFPISPLVLEQIYYF